MNPNSTQKRIAFGYNRDYGKVVINEGQAAAVKLIFMYYLDGKSLAEIKDQKLWLIWTSDRPADTANGVSKQSVKF